MENPNQSISHSTQLSTQGYNHQMQSAMWSGNKVCQNTSGQNASMDHYSQQMNRYAPYPSQTSNDVNRYLPPVSKDQNSNSVPYSSQFPMARQNSYSCTNPSQNYMTVKSNCSNVYYGSVNADKNYPANNMVSSPKKYANSSLGLSPAPTGVPQIPQVSHNTGAHMPQMPHYGDQSSYQMQNMYVSNYSVYASGDNQQSYMLRQSLSSPTSALSSQDASSIHSIAMVPSNQVSSIPTPPETSSLPGDAMSGVDTVSADVSADGMKMNISNSSFVLPGTVVSHMPSNMPSPVSSIGNAAAMSSRNVGNALQPPANVDEGSQASSASASSSIPDEQSSAKTNSKPNFSYPPTPNTLSSPGAASMSSFHDDLECISSPGWPKTPASPVANSNYEFANIKRPENLLKLYTLSDEPDRRYFLDKLIVFNEDRGSPITQCPTISKQPLDVFRVYLTVKERGGFVEVTNAKRWKDIAGAIGVGASSSAAYTLRKQYMKLLLPFECKFDRGGVDPQPIINMVEASSRKKGKNSTTTSYGNQNHYNQAYPQPMDRYHTGYPGSYPSSRYPCNNVMDYQCTSNAVHYQQTATSHTASHNTMPGQNQYNQYSHSTPSNYGYYQGNNSATSPMYNNVQNNISNNICRYGNSAASSPVPQEQGYYSHQYSPQHQGQSIQDNGYGSSRGCSIQENLPAAAVNQASNEREQRSPYSIVSNATGISPLTSENSQHQKSINESYGSASATAVTVTNSSSEALPDTKLCYNNSYTATPKPNVLDQNSLVAKNCNPVNAISQSYQQSAAPESSLNSVTDVNFYADTAATSHQVSVSYPNRNQNSYINQAQSPYPNQKLPYQGDCQNKDQVQSSQYSRYTETQNESYRGSEGPPAIQGDQSRNMSSDGTVSSKSYQYNRVTPKINAYGTQQASSKEPFNNTVYCNQFGTRPQRAWLPEQNQYTYHPHAGQRPPLKTQMTASDVKQNPETTRVRKSWLNNQPTTQAQSKFQNTASVTQSSASNKSQPQSLPASQAFQSMAKKPLEFPPNTVEAIKPVAVKRRRCPAKRLGTIDPWRIMLALKSGLLAESTWALDALSILLADNNTVVYFGLSHLPGLLNVLVDHYRCFLNKIFRLANDVEIGYSEDLDKKNISSDLSCLGSDDNGSWEGKIKLLDSPNFTYKTRCKKTVQIQYDEALFLIDPQRSWDKFEGFDVAAEHWQKGGGDITSHIQTSFDSCSKKVKFHRDLIDEKKLKSEKLSSDMKSLPSFLKEKPNMLKSSLLFKGEPIVVLKKFNFLADKAFTLSDEESVETPEIESSNSNFSKKSDDVISDKNDGEKDRANGIDGVEKPASSEDCISGGELNEGKEMKCDMDAINIMNNKKSDAIDDVKEKVESLKTNDTELSENVPRLRGSLSSRKRFLCEDLEDEAYCFDQPALCVINDSQEMLSRRCVCVSTILRNLSFVPGNDLVMSKNPGVLLLLGRLLLLHHEHKPAKNAYHKYEKEADGSVSWNESCISLKDEQEWWWSTLSVLRDNTLVILSNISGHLDLSPFPEEVSLPILDGLLHWVVCPSSYAQDPLPSRSLSSVLSPQRLCLEALCKLSVLSSNVDLIIATPPWSRIENLLAFLTKSLSYGQDQIMREFAVILLSNISQADSVAARTIAEQSRCISYLIAFIEEAEANAFQIASSQGTKKLRDKPELMGTTPGMVQRAANTLKNLALVPENQGLFIRYQPRLLSLVMSQVMDQELAAVIADVLFYCSDEILGDISCQLPVS
ncbi:Trithorax group protein osa, partial [Stegodyphus mimosarum]